MSDSEINCSIGNLATNGGDMVSVEKYYKMNILDLKIGTETCVHPRSVIWIVSKI